MFVVRSPERSCVTAQRDCALTSKRRKNGWDMTLPALANEDEYVAVYRNSDVWLPAMRAICARHGLDARALEIAPPGSHIVFWAGPRRLIKLFSRFWPDDAVSERVALGGLTAHTTLPMPRVIAEGELEGWPYLVLEPLPGIPLNQVWEQVEARDRAAICETLGGVMAALHAAPTTGLSAIAVDWPAWLAERRAGFAAAQTERGASPEWIAAALGFPGGDVAGDHDGRAGVAQRGYHR